MKKSIFRKLAKTMNQFRGIEIGDYNFDSVHFTCSLQPSLLVISFCTFETSFNDEDSNCTSQVIVLPDGSYYLSLMHDDDLTDITADKLITEMNIALEEEPRLKKDFSSKPFTEDDEVKISSFLFDDTGKQKIKDYISYLRQKTINSGLEEEIVLGLDFDEILGLHHSCCDCGTELCSKDNLFNTIIEFDDPKRAYKALQKIEK